MKSTDKHHSAYRVRIPYTCAFTFTDDGHITKVTIETNSEVVRYGRDKKDIELQMELDKEYGKQTYAKHMLKWVGGLINDIDPRDVATSYGDIRIIEEPMTKAEIDEFIESCLNDA